MLQDVLILEQFMRKDGTVLPKELTGLCFGQQLRLERCIMQVATLSLQLKLEIHPIY